jgi:hypothetical protein
MMKIDIHHSNALEPPVLHGMEGGPRGVVEEAESEAHAEERAASGAAVVGPHIRKRKKHTKN